MNNDIEELLNKLDESINNCEEVKMFFKVKKALQENTQLMELEQSIRIHQKKMVESIANKEEYDKERNIYNSLKKEYDSNILVIEYESIKSDVYDLLKQVSSIIND